MKKTALLLILLLSLLAASCSGRADPKQSLEFPLKLTARTEGSEAYFIADMTEERCEITFQGSAALEDTRLVLEDGGNSATVNSFTRRTKEGTFPPQEMLYKSLKLLQGGDQMGVETQNGVKYTIDETVILVYYDKSTGVLTGIETEESGRRFKFTLLSLESHEAQSNGAG